MTDCGRFQHIAWEWLRSGEITRTAHMLSPLEELAGFNYGFIYLLEVMEDSTMFAGANGRITTRLGQRRCQLLAAWLRKPVALVGLNLRCSRADSGHR